MIIQLKEICLSFGLAPIFDHINLVISESQRIALVGRNGEGKSTFLKMLAKQIQPDSGRIDYISGLRINYLPQAIPDINKTVTEIITDSLTSFMESWQVEAHVEKIIAEFELPKEANFNSLSGGIKRRVLLAQAFASNPDLLLLDEPTNHLDIPAVQFLEKIILNYKATVLFVSHDRCFTQKLATMVYDLDRGKLTAWECDYNAYLIHKDEQLKGEEKERNRFDKKLAKEEVWIRQGIKARGTRNEGRVRALKEMRRAKQEQRNRKGSINLKITHADTSGKMVISAEGITYTIDNKTIIKPFSIEIQRGDKIGIIGRNGCGKSTLIQLLLKQIPATSGTIKHGTNLSILYFDQMRNQIDDNQTVADNVGQGKSHIEFNGKSIHIISYLQHFLFEPERARSLAYTLSGGERNRLLLAKLFTQPANVLVFDEPSNDLDMETLELLESLLVDYDGTLLLVSHDRTLIDNVVTSTLVFDEQNNIQEYIGGYEDYLRQAPKTDESQSATLKVQAASKNKFSYEVQKELAKLPDKITKLENKIAQLQQQFSDSFSPDTPNGSEKIANELKDSEEKLALLYKRWEELEG